MILEEAMATLSAMKEIVEELYQGVQKVRESESPVHTKGGGEGGGS